ncbi:phosphoinositide phospholipase C 2 [Olea europaea subsp. europaea]|uniref:Phosphoinositide phospholipase C n=1 Tax=Olea europaea subsp. europaea TaxID=158383 RepID=A0A8S0UYB9_OLEEU|nr:phosphoinositide phospholipase C 2 [Olea europaea subsp. europaea]
MLKQHFRVCCCFWRHFNLVSPQVHDDVKEIFQQYSEDGLMTVNNLHTFLIEIQEESDASKEQAQEIIDNLRHLHFFPRKGLHVEAFFRYLLSDHNIPLSTKVHHDMTAPLPHYFMYTGHNSYLTGNQVYGKSSYSPIIKALRKGVRVIELDLWPNSRKTGVNVLHGGTFTAPVKLNKCLIAIKDNAFSASAYPVILTFEDHLPQELQTKVAQMVKRIYGEMLYQPKPDSQEFLSPEELKKRIIISTKPPKEYLESQSQDRDQLNDQSKDEEEAFQTTSPEYKRLIGIHAEKVKSNLRESLRLEQGKVRRLSLSEQELKDAAKDHGDHLVRFTQQHLLRIYPKGTRVGSSNYNPVLGWIHGAQMVAFNMQGDDRYLWIMQGMFRANGGCGYVKKPDILMKVGPNDEVCDLSRAELLEVKQTLKVKIYMGEGWLRDFHLTHFDWDSPPDLYAKLSIIGVAADSIKRRTEKIDDQWEPAWDEEFEFELRVPELALLLIVVNDYDRLKEHEFAGQTCLPISELRTGIRSVPLHDRRGNRYRHVRLLMRFQFV